MGNQVKTRSASLSPSRAVRVFGMRRSGNHAIINWMLRNAPDGGAVFLNNCVMNRDPVKTHKTLEVFFDGTELSFPPDMGLQAKFDMAGQGPVAFVSCEDVMPPTPVRELTPAWPRKAPEETVVIIFRSFLNWSASLLQKLMGNDKLGPIARMRILTMACKTYAAGLQLTRKKSVIPICYDDWYAKDTYRSHVLEQLGFPQRDNSLGQVQRYGGGSSFQADAADARELTSLGRADQLANDPEYKLFLWLASHDTGFMRRLARVFPEDAHRLTVLAENAQIWASLPMAEVPA